MRNLKYAFRHLWRNKTSSLLNIAGLSLGITSALLIFLFIRHELSYDTFHAKKDRTYRVGMSVTRNGETSQSGSTTLALKHVLEESFPQIENEATTYYLYNSVFIIDPEKEAAPAKKFKQLFGVAYVSPSFYEMFDFKWAIGDYKKVLSEPNSAAVSKSIAEKFFGIKDGAYSNAIGHTLKLNNQVQLTVSGIIEDPPGNSDFPFEIVISQVTHYNSNKGAYEIWGSNYGAVNHYVLLKKGASLKEFDAQLKAFSKKQFAELPAGTDVTFFTQPLSDLHYNAEMSNYSFKTTDKKTLYSLGIIGVFLIITACVNFINLATAQAAKRSKEVGIKKTLGAGKGLLFSSFMQEITLIVIFSAALSAAVAEVITPYLSEKLELGIEYNSFTDISAFAFLSLVSIATIFLAGSYPSLLMSKTAPIKAMKGGLSGGADRSGMFLRRSLVVFQFVLSQALIISALVISGQIEFFRTKDLGFNKDFVLLVDIPNDGLKQRDYLYNSFMNLPNVKETSFSFTPPNNLGSICNTIFYPNGGEVKEVQFEIKPADTKFIDMYGLKLIAGRNFTAGDSLDRVIVNEALLREAGISDAQAALGYKARVGINNLNVEITGVVKDFYLADLRQEIYPMIMFNLTPDQNFFGTSMANIQFKKFGSKEEIQNTIKGIQKIWEASFPEEIFESRFLDEAIYKQYSDQEGMSNIIKFFTVIAVLIGCIGLYGLITFIAAQKTKEIGVRKVLGASTYGIAALLSKEFLLLLGLSFLAAWPISYYLMNKWLEDYPERISVGFGIFVPAALIALGVSMAAISYKAVKAASANPVKSLKYE